MNGCHTARPFVSTLRIDFVWSPTVSGAPKAWGWILTIDSCIFCFFASLLFCFSAALLFCSLRSLLLCFSVSLLSLLLFFPAIVLLCLSDSTSTISPFLFFSHAFCCSTSCSSASLFPVFTVSVFFILFCFILCILNETLERAQSNPNETQ